MGILSRQPWKIVLGLALAFSFVACTEKSYGPPENKAPIETQGPSPLGDLAPVVPASLSTLEPVDAYLNILEASQEESLARAQEIVEKVVRPIAIRLLSSQTLTDRELLSSSQYFSYLRAMQEGILQAARMDSANTGLRTILELYERMILKPCAIPGSTCSELKFVARDARYAFVIMRLTKILGPSVRDSWRYLSYSMDFGLFPNSTEYSNFALDTMVGYIRELSNRPNEEVREELIRLKKVANQIVLSIQGRNETVAAFFERIDIWGDDTEGDMTRSILRSALWPVLVDGYAIIRGQATPSFARFVERQLNDFEANVIGQFRSKPERALAFENLNLKDLSEIDKSLLFVVDQTYEGKLSAGDALAILSSLNPSNESLITAAEQYIQIRFAQLVIRTQEELSQHLGNPESYQTIKQLQEQLAKAAPLEVEWARLQERVSILKSLIESKAAEGEPISTDESRRLDTIFNKMDRNIKWFAIYPNMLPVVYFMSKSNLADTIKILWFRFKLTSDMIFKMLFDGYLGGWFNFTNALADDYTRFSASELLLAFRNALLSGLFDSYQIEVSDFLLETTDRITMGLSAQVEDASRALYEKLLVDYETKFDRNYFNKAYRFCQGDKSAIEEIDYKDMMRYLSPFTSDLDGSLLGVASSRAEIHELRLPGREFPEESIYNLVDFYRTDDMFYLDMLEKMVAIYKDYLKAVGKEDPRLAEVEEKHLKFHMRLRHVYGIFFQITRRFHSCQDQVRNLFKQRILQVFNYEEIYIRRAFADVQRVAQNPALLDEVNASYRKTYPEIQNVETKDRIIQRDGTYQFLFNKADFMLRLREYFLFGVRKADGTQLPAIAPDMNIRIPTRLLAVERGYGDYKFFYDNRDVANVEFRSGMTLDDFMTDYLSMAFYSDSGDLSEGITPQRLGAKPWVEWPESLARSVTLSKSRILMLGSLYKLGTYQIYDFDKPGCAYNMAYEELEKNCVTETKIAAEEILTNQVNILNFVSLTPEYLRLFDMTKSSLIAGRDKLENSFFMAPTWRPIGILDGYRYALGQEGLGSSVIFPGEVVDSRMVRSPHTGYITRATEYYVNVASNGAPLIQPKEELSGRIKEMFQGYVDREWKPLIELEELAEREEAAGRGYYDLNLIRNYEPFRLPLLTPYSTPVRFLQLELNRKTEFIYARPQ